MYLMLNWIRAPNCKCEYSHNIIYNLDENLKKIVFKCCGKTTNREKHQNEKSTHTGIYIFTLYLFYYPCVSACVPVVFYHILYIIIYSLLGHKLKAPGLRSSMISEDLRNEINNLSTAGVSSGAISKFAFPNVKNIHRNAKIINRLRQSLKV
jgi:hypothetical protein